MANFDFLGPVELFVKKDYYFLVKSKWKIEEGGFRHLHFFKESRPVMHCFQCLSGYTLSAWLVQLTFANVSEERDLMGGGGYHDDE